MKVCNVGIRGTMESENDLECDVWLDAKRDMVCVKFRRRKDGKKYGCILRIAAEEIEHHMEITPPAAEYVCFTPSDPLWEEYKEHEKEA